MEGDEYPDCNGPEAGGPINNLIEAKLRAVVTEFAHDAFSPAHCNAAARNAVAALRRWTAETFPIGVEAALLPYLEQLAGWAVNPETGQRLSDDALSVIGPLLE